MKWLFVIAAFILISSCNTAEDNPTFIYKDELSGTLIADTIIYDVIIKDTTLNDFWSKQCLKGVNHKEFIDDIFNNIYNEKIQALHFLSEEKLPIKDIEEMEHEDWFSREAIGKIQFTEIWYYNPNHAVMNKIVLSLTLGVEQYDNNNKLKGYKPIFKVYLN